jgi:hypothetical protein
MEKPAKEISDTFGRDYGYHGSRALQANWIHTKDTESWLRQMKIGHTLNVCCGTSLVGEVRIDTDEKSSRTEAGDLFDLAFEPLSFDTVICDPPFSYYGKLAWISKLRKLPRKRLIISVPQISLRMFFGRSAWKLSLWAMDATTPYLRLFYVADRMDGFLLSPEMGI